MTAKMTPKFKPAQSHAKFSNSGKSIMATLSSVGRGGDNIIFSDISRYFSVRGRDGRSDRIACRNSRCSSLLHNEKSTDV
jgi:hypothetical protein